jgi:hypothetical protein
MSRDYARFDHGLNPIRSEIQTAACALGTRFQADAIVGQSQVILSKVVTCARGLLTSPSVFARFTS